MTGLEALEQLRNDIENRALLFSEDKLEIIEKELKALEIIKEKKVNLDILTQCDSVELYNKCIHYFDRQLTQEEYDSLKKVLL